MKEAIQPDHSLLGKGITEDVESESTLSGFLSYLVFEGHPVRLGLEISSIVVTFTLFDLLLPWSALGIDERWHSITSWFTACSAIILFDQLFLCQPAHVLRSAYQLSLLGVFEKSLEVLEFISPDSNRLIRLPASIYHLFRAEVFIQMEAFHCASAELQLAAEAGAPDAQIHVLRSRLYRNEPKADAISRAQAELRSANTGLGTSATLSLEEGLLLLETRKDLWAAKRLLKEVCEMPPEAHFAGETTSQIARAGYEASRLWTGEAEEGLEGLNVAIDNLRAAAGYIDTLRPLLAHFYLERSHYLALHKEPQAAFDDLRTGLALCCYSHIRRRAKTVQDEIFSRYGQPVTPV